MKDSKAQILPGNWRAETLATGSNSMAAFAAKPTPEKGASEFGIWGNDGTEVYLGHDVGRPQLIDELLVTAWVKADRPGIQLAAQVILPRTLDPRTGRPVSTILRGSTFSLPGQWQQLPYRELASAHDPADVAPPLATRPGCRCPRSVRRAGLVECLRRPGNHQRLDRRPRHCRIRPRFVALDRSHASAPAPDGGNVASRAAARPNLWVGPRRAEHPGAGG